MIGFPSAEIDRFVVAKLTEVGQSHNSPTRSALTPSPRRGGLGRGDDDQTTTRPAATPLPGPPHQGEGEQTGTPLQQSPEADKVTLLRRLHLDLIGLPPTIDEVDTFLADASPDAYEKQVERLLKSPHYGERWGRHWLDAARYADSDGFEKDKSRQVAFYRDYVIDALNRDLPYNQFVIEQLAGDLLPQPTQDQIVATGFLRNSMLNEEGGVDPEQFRMDAMFDRMDAVGKTFLGLTIQCAQCHTHKYDPITHEEYFRLFAFLNNDHEAQRVVYSVEEQAKISDLRREMAVIESRLQQQTHDWHERMKTWEETVAVDALDQTSRRRSDGTLRANRPHQTASRPRRRATGKSCNSKTRATTGSGTSTWGTVRSSRRVTRRRSIRRLCAVRPMRETSPASGWSCSTIRTCHATGRVARSWGRVR